MTTPPRPSARPPVIGNDVVDTDDPRCRGKDPESRFARRVLAEPERAAVAAAPDPEAALWLRWAAKEAAYKVVTKLLGAPPPFTHASFVVEVEAGSPARGWVRYESFRVPFHVVSERNPLHVLALNPELPDHATGESPPTLASGVAPAPSADGPGPEIEVASDFEEWVRERFTERERGAVRTLDSAFVRLHARRELARMLGVDERRVEIVCEAGQPGRTPPVALLDRAPAPADVSLSHHGRWLGWAVQTEPR